MLNLDTHILLHALHGTVTLREKAALSKDRWGVWPISREVCLNIAALDFRSDPADELIASTSLTYGAPLMTRDKKIRASKVIRIL